MIIRPRINDFYGIPFTQEEVDFAIPFLDEDLPLFIDPFLLWKSPSQQDTSLHLAIINSFNYLGGAFVKGNTEIAKTVVNLSECNEIGLGNSKTRVGKRIGHKSANEILLLYRDIPQISTNGVTHFEEIQLFVDSIAQDRVSDISANLIKSFLIDYTIDQAKNITYLLKKQPPLFSVINRLNLNQRMYFCHKIQLPSNRSYLCPNDGLDIRHILVMTIILTIII